MLDLIVDPECGVDVHQLRYNTLDPPSQATTASGALMIPTGTNAACQGARPIVVYAHGTAAEKVYNIADLTDSDNAEGLLIAAAFAAQGYIVVAPNYAGYDTSTLAYHPYLHAKQQAKDTCDALTAARSALPTSTAPTITDNGRLFITGYSQGGHVAMATHRLHASERRDRHCVGADVGAVCARRLRRCRVPRAGHQQRAAAGELAHDRLISAVYGNIYAAPTDAFEARTQRASMRCYRLTGTRGQLYDQGLLPREQLFNSTPPDPAYAAYTPATAPSDLAPVFARGFGTEALITNAFGLSYLQDSLAHPDGGFPNRDRWACRPPLPPCAAHRFQGERPAQLEPDVAGVALCRA